jgi:hypothetical protein
MNALSMTDWTETEADPADVAFAEKYGLGAFIRKLLRGQAEKFKAELAAGATAEREEEILAWFAFQEMRERLQRARAIRQEKDPLVDLPRPGLLN